MSGVHMSSYNMAPAKRGWTVEGLNDNIQDAKRRVEGEAEKEGG